MAKQISLQYLAGFFDGEGCVSSELRTEGRKAPYLRVSVTQKHPEILQEFKRRFGGWIGEKRKGAVIGRCFMWQACTAKAYYLLQALLPFLQVKHRQAVVGMQLASRAMLNNKYKSISLAEFKLRRRLACEISRLNHL